MFSNQIQGQQAAGTQEGTARKESPFGVLIDRDGSTAVDGVPFQAPEGEPVHVAVLDLMHRHARARRRPVEVVILDQQRGDATLVEVAPDGSSRIVLHEELDGTAGERSRSAVVPEPAVAELAVPESAAAGARPADTAHPAGGGVPEGTEAVPDGLGELVALICRSVDTGASERAAALAFRLSEHTTRAFGPEHRHTLQAHALQAFVAHRGGNAPLATSMCLELARIRHRQGDPRAYEELTRATAAWLRADDVPSAVEHGRTLLALWYEWTDRDGAKVADATLPRLVNRRIRALAGETGTRMTGVA